VLTGLLSSFPLFKDIDTWLLRKLHRAAFIPDDARDLAKKLYNSEFEPRRPAIETIDQIASNEIWDIHVSIDMLASTPRRGRHLRRCSTTKSVTVRLGQTIHVLDARPHGMTE
jgi:hypothetical protein